MSKTTIYQVQGDYKAKGGWYYTQSKADAIAVCERRQKDDKRGHYWVVKVTSEVIKSADDPTGAMIMRGCLSAPDEEH